MTPQNSPLDMLPVPHVFTFQVKSVYKLVIKQTTMKQMLNHNKILLHIFSSPTISFPWSYINEVSFKLSSVSFKLNICGTYNGFIVNQ